MYIINTIWPGIRRSRVKWEGLNPNGRGLTPNMRELEGLKMEGF